MVTPAMGDRFPLASFTYLVPQILPLGTGFRFLIKSVLVYGPFRATNLTRERSALGRCIIVFARVIDRGILACCCLAVATPRGHCINSLAGRGLCLIVTWLSRRLLVVRHCYRRFLNLRS